MEPRGATPRSTGPATKLRVSWCGGEVIAALRTPPAPRYCERSHRPIARGSANATRRRERRGERLLVNNTRDVSPVPGASSSKNSFFESVEHCPVRRSTSALPASSRRGLSGQRAAARRRGAAKSRSTATARASLKKFRPSFRPAKHLRAPRVFASWFVGSAGGRTTTRSREVAEHCNSKSFFKEFRPSFRPAKHLRAPRVFASWFAGSAGGRTTTRSREVAENCNYHSSAPPPSATLRVLRASASQLRDSPVIERATRARR